MSFFNGKVPTKEALSKLKYHELKPAFEEIGVAEVWKHGRKGEEMITEALKAYEALRQMEAKKAADAAKAKGAEGDLSEKESELENKGEDKGSENESFKGSKEAIITAVPGISKEAQRYVDAGFSEEAMKSKIELVDINLKNGNKNMATALHVHRRTLVEAYKAISGKIYDEEKE